MQLDEIAGQRAARMRPNLCHRCLFRILGMLCVMSSLLVGCTVVGPAAMRAGRLAYNEAIIETDKEQMLLVVVRNRYEERSQLLAVGSVTANVSVVARSGIELGFGNDQDFAANLVPFGAGVVYEENPTISYTPVGGEQYVRALTSPVPLAGLAQLASSVINPSLVYNALIASVNGIYNPSFTFSPVEPDPRFGRFVTIMTKLTRAHRLQWVQDTEHARLVIDHYSPTYAVEVSELLRLLGLPGPRDPTGRMVLPVSLALDGPNTGGMAIVTRSVANLLQILSGAVQIPEEDLAAGVAVRYPSPGPVGGGLRVHRAEAKPTHASVAVKYRNAWFYIDERDQLTKQFARLVGTLLSIAIEESTERSSATPLLTLPLSR